MWGLYFTNGQQHFRITWWFTNPANKVSIGFNLLADFVNHHVTLKCCDHL